MTELKKFRKQTAPMQVVDYVRDCVRIGKLRVGDRLPNESEFALSLGIGRSAFREGIRILEAYGVVEVRQGEGTYVINRCSEQVLEFLGFFPNEGNMRPLIELRQIVEVGAMRLAVPRVSKAHVQELLELAAKLDSGQATDTNIALDKRFHELIIESTANPLLIQTYSMLTRMQHALMDRLMRHKDVVRDARISHLNIAQRISERNVEGAVEAMKEHLDKVLRYEEAYVQGRK